MKSAPTAKRWSLPAPSWSGSLTARLAHPTRSAPFSGPGWAFELKYDGFRLVAAKDGAEVSLRYRSGRDATRLFPELVDAVRSLPASRALLDGELVAFGSDGKPDFELLLSRANRRQHSAAARACLFDLLALDAQDLRGLPLLERKDALSAVLAGTDDRLVFVEHVIGRGEDLFRGACDLGLEGVVAKRSDAPYRPGRTELWRKFKNEVTTDAPVLGLAQPSDATFGLPALVVGRWHRHRVVPAGRVPVTPRRCVEALQLCAPRGGQARGVRWLSEGLVCEVRHLATGGPAFRHPQFVRFRPDKTWVDCAG